MPMEANEATGTNVANSEPKRRPGIGWIVFGVVLFIAGAGGGIAGVYGTVVTSLYDIERAVFPGERIIPFEEAGTYTIAREHRSVIEGRTYTSPEPPPSTEYRLVSMSVEGEIDLKPLTGSYSYHMGAYEGKGLFTAQIETPGDYMLMAHYSDRSDQPEFVLAVHPGTFFTTFIGAMLFGCGGGIVALIGIAFTIVGIVRFASSPA